MGEPGQPTSATNQFPYVHMKRYPCKNRGKTADAFRLIRAFTIDHNADRLRRHIEREFKEDRRTQSGRCFAMKMRRRAASTYMGRHSQ